MTIYSSKVPRSKKKKKKSSKVPIRASEPSFCSCQLPTTRYTRAKAVKSHHSSVKTTIKKNLIQDSAEL